MFIYWELIAGEIEMRGEKDWGQRTVEWRKREIQRKRKEIWKWKSWMLCSAKDLSRMIKFFLAYTAQFAIERK